MDGAKEQLSELKRLALMAVGELGQKLPKVDLIDNTVENQIKIDSIYLDDVECLLKSSNMDWWDTKVIKNLIDILKELTND